MKIVFFGTPEFSEKFLSALIADRDFSVVAVVCQPDAPVGRKKILTPPATKLLATEHGIPVLQPEKLKDQNVIDQLAALQADLFIVVAYGRIIPESILKLARLGTVNVHPSLLPKYRGPSPIQSAIVSGETETGVSIMLLDEQMDHGPILAQKKIDISGGETPETLREKAVAVATPVLIESLKKFAAGELIPKPQDDSQATICRLLTREDGRIDWSGTGSQIDAQIRGLTPWPGTWTTWNAVQLKIIKAQPSTESLPAGQVAILNHRLLIGTSTTALEILELQLEGAKALSAHDFLLGHREINHATLE
jgi:methionyl-tRNA formyltransferase